MSDWSSEDVLRFLDCYQGEPCIWDPSNINHKDKKKLADAWSRLSNSLNKPVKELKTKKEILMVTFRKHLKKKQECIRSGAGIEDLYEPTWFAYQPMEAFLLPIYTVKLGLNSETQSRSSENTVTEMVDEEIADDSLVGPSTSAVTASAPFTKKSTDKSRRRPASDLAEQQMAIAFGQLTNVLSERQSKSSDADNEDECDLYAKLLAKKIRELPKDERKLVMYEIDGIFIQKIKRRTFLRETPSPQYFPCSRPSSASSAYMLPNRPPRVQSSFSEPYSTSHYGSLTPHEFSNFERTSTPLQPPPTRQNTNDNINIYHNEPISSNSRPAINIISDEVIIPPNQNIVKTALLKAFKDIDQYKQ